MITARRSKDRRHHGRRKQQGWRTFSPENRRDPLADGFGNLEIFDEDALPPGAGVARRPRHDVEVVTYVSDGALAFEDSLGRSGVIQAGEFQCTTAGPSARHSETNASRTDWARVFQMWLQPSEAGIELGGEEKRFSTAERRNRLCVVASPDARRGSLRVHQDAVICSAVLDSGQHVAHALTPGRSAWVHVVRGEVTLDGIVLSAGDGAGISDERVVSITAREESEVLLLDLGEPPPRSKKGKGRKNSPWPIRP